MVKEKLTWFDSKGQEFYFDYKITKNRYESHTKEELQDLLLMAQRREEEGLSMTETIIKIENALEKK